VTVARHDFVRQSPFVGEKTYILSASPKANEQVLNRYIKEILEDLSESVPTLKEKVPTKLTMKQKDANKKEGKEPETDLNGNVILPRFKCVTSHTARRTGITNMYLSHKYDIVQMMHVSGHKTKRPSWTTSNSPPRI